LHTYHGGNGPHEAGDGRRLDSSATTVVVTSDGASALGKALVAVVVTGAPPPSKELAREALVRRHDGGGLVGNGARSQVKFTWGMALFIGETPSTHRGCGDDPDLSQI
jgi:hypothetical protein